MEAKYEMLINSQDHLLVKVTILYTVLRLSKVIINSLYCELVQCEWVLSVLMTAVRRYQHPWHAHGVP